jgi:hypothetical protein
MNSAGGASEFIITAGEASALCRRKERSRDVNYTLTLRRLMRVIDTSARNGSEGLVFEAPTFVVDGCLGDPIVLARQLKARLTQAGYIVTRNNSTLSISWAPPPKALPAARKSAVSAETKRR